MDSYSPRQLCALLWAALAAPLAMTCAAVSWPWVLLGGALAGAFLLYQLCMARRLAPQVGFVQLLGAAYGGGGLGLLILYWMWLVLSLGSAAALSARAFPMDRGFPLIPLVLLLLAALPAAKGAGVVCRFGATLFLAVAALMAVSLAFGAADVQAENLRPGGMPEASLGTLSVLLLPAAALLLRDRSAAGPWKCGRWYLGAVALALGVSLVTVGALGLPLAGAAGNPFWLMSRSISVLGVMERFEAVISAVLAISACCLLAFLLSAGQTALRSACPAWGQGPAAWTTAAAGAAAMWAVPLIPDWVWPAGSLLFWGILPAVTLGVVQIKKSKKIEKNS